MGQTLPLVCRSWKRGPSCPWLRRFVGDHQRRSRRYLSPCKTINSKRTHMPLPVRRHVTHTHDSTIVTPPLISAGPKELLQRTDLVFQGLHRFDRQSAPPMTYHLLSEDQNDSRGIKDEALRLKGNTSPNKHTFNSMIYARVLSHPPRNARANAPRKEGMGRIFHAFTFSQHECGHITHSYDRADSHACSPAHSSYHTRRYIPSHHVKTNHLHEMMPPSPLASAPASFLTSITGSSHTHRSNRAVARQRPS